MTFVYDNDVYFAIPSKYTDAGSGGWHLSFVVWEPDTATASWVDGDSGTGGIQEVISKTDLDVNGFYHFGRLAGWRHGPSGAL